MKILILYEFNNHYQLINSLCQNLIKQGIESDSFNMENWRFMGQNKQSKPLLLSLLAPLLIIPKVKSILSILFRNRIVLNLSDKCNIVDIHFYSTIYDDLIDQLIKRGKKVKITIWGSDFYKADKIRREQQRKFYHKVEIIQIATLQMRNDFLMVYPECTEKVRLAHFGIFQFDIINELLQKFDSETFKKELGLPAEKIIIACGTNGSERHQHNLILESISKLDSYIKEQVFLLFPMTYGSTKPYIETIKQKVDSVGLPYKMFSASLSINEICKLRIVSDILITIQKTDAFSAAVQEHIYSGNILISGDWLPYQKLHEYGVFYLTTNLESLTETISKTIENHTFIKNKCIANKFKIAKMSSWNMVINDWLAIYNELIMTRQRQVKPYFNDQVNRNSKGGSFLE